MLCFYSIYFVFKLFLTTIFHNIPEGISIAVPIYYATKSKKEAYKKAFLSGIAEPIGAVLAFIFLKKYITDMTISIILVIVAGLMITLAIQELVPKALKYNENKYLYLGLISGVVLVIINVYLF